MLCTENFAFIHVPKTGGMSVTRFLINAINDPITVFVPKSALEHTRQLADTDRAASKLTCRIGERHENPAQALRLIEKHGLTKPPLAFSVIRHPVDLMLSYYKHMRKPRVWRIRGMSRSDLWGAPKLAMENDFDSFCKKALFYQKTDEELLSYFEPSSFKTLDVVPIERLNEYFSLRLSNQLNFDRSNLEHRNKSDDARTHEDLSRDTIAHIERTYSSVLKAYQRSLEKNF